ncbi:hypothetical protein LOTGIDRAFT_162599 [Lottia gigantea]|uniref:G-protein coupled receptors family 1 profile domain-containing protein n=1 Tax=Lottia gigantea TaxID=225164 RepID=V3ZMS0_LOTGI|nr:hypothetical protein LOTGIDRAFT_162599 [Lottia gigantea]ESO92673.1 hypothetical protein LOTGIDRAFT_162599 [Lottia gigantea]
MDSNFTGLNGTQHVFVRYSIAELHEIFAPTAAAIDQCVTPILYVCGILTNPLSAYIWLSRNTRKNNSSAIYLGILSITHFFFNILHIFVELNYAWGVKTYNVPISCEVFYAIYYIPQYLPPLLVLGFTVERYIAICFPYNKHEYCTVRRAVLVISGLTVLSVLLGVVQAYFWTYDPEKQDCDHRASAREGGNASIISIWTWVTEILIFSVVPLAALVFNILVIIEIRALSSGGPAHLGPGSGSSQTASTVTLLCVSFYLIFTWLPATVVYSIQMAIPLGGVYLTDDQIKIDPTWSSYFTYYIIRKILEEFTISNSACYFFIYYITGKHFRQETKDILGVDKCCQKRQGKTTLSGYTTVNTTQVINGNATNV